MKRTPTSAEATATASARRSRFHRYSTLARSVTKNAKYAAATDGDVEVHDSLHLALHRVRRHHEERQVEADGQHRAGQRPHHAA